MPSRARPTPPPAAPALPTLRTWLWLGGAAAVLVLLWLLGPILTPFVLGAGLAYLGDPLVDRLQRWKLSRTAGVTIVFLVIFGGGLLALIALVPMLERQLVTLISNIPEWLQWLQARALPALGIQAEALEPERLRELVAENWGKAGSFAAVVLGKVTQSGLAMLTFVINLLLLPVVTFYLLRDWDVLVAGVRELLPRRVLPRVTQLARETDETLSAFLRGQLLVMTALSVFYVVGLWIGGLDLAVLVGLVAGLTSFIPYLGPIVGVGAATIAMLTQTQDLMQLIPIAIVFGLGQVLESMVLTPWLVGDRIGLHPVAVIFAVMAGGQLFGFVGVLLGLPIAAALAVLLRHARELWLDSDAYTER